MTTIKLTIEYDGTDYAGWQFQLNSSSLQQAVETALARICKVPVRVFSSGRTDAGVHARGMVVHFKTDDLLPMSAYREGVNNYLPADIAIVSAEEVSDDFHARYSALAKKYRYSIYQGDVSSPLIKRYGWHVKPALDIELMNRAASYLIGQHDFAAFRSSGCTAKTTVREIYSARFKKHGRQFYFDIIGSGFLRNMVRVIVGTLIEVGDGSRSYEDIDKLLKTGQRDRSGVTAPPQGLCLMQVWYDGNPQEWRAKAKPCNSCQKSLDKHC